MVKDQKLNTNLFPDGPTTGSVGDCEPTGRVLFFDETAEKVLKRKKKVVCLSMLEGNLFAVR